LSFREHEMNVEPSHRRIFQALGCVFACGAIASCGGKAVANGGAAGASGGATNSVGGSATNSVGSSVSGGTCPEPAPAPPAFDGGPPASFGCAVERGGVWLETPCSCELWLSNPSPAPVDVSISFAFTPADWIPAYAVALDRELHVRDPDSAWYDVWARQAARTAMLSVTHVADITSVRLDASELTLDSVSLPGCAADKPTASVTGPWGELLDLKMQAILTDANGHSVATSMADCAQPATHPTVGLGGASSADAGSEGSAPPR
jgi:hypothetical protein